MRITIDGRNCDIETLPSIPIGYCADSLSKELKLSTAKKMRVTLPPTKTNRLMLGHPENLNAITRFNELPHIAKVMQGYTTLFSGEVRLVEVSANGYILEIKSNIAGWVRGATTRSFDKIPIAYSSQLTPQTIKESWSDESPVKFLPIHRDKYPQQNSSSDLLTAEHILTIGDYHPFLSVKTIVENILEGYTIESSFMESAPFTELYMSGEYASKNSDALDKRMGFRAGRLTSKTATADWAGKVYATPFGGESMLGNIVEIATPYSKDEDNIELTDVWNNGGCFSVESQKIVFRPTTNITATFEYYLKYTTDHYIESRTKLRGFDSINLGSGSDYSFGLTNRYIDKRADIATNREYRIVVFDHVDGAQYRLTYTKGAIHNTQWALFSSRTALVTSDANEDCSNPKLYVKVAENWILYINDWALYNGYIGERGQTTVELRVKSAPETLAPTSPKWFNTIYFHGADGGMKLKLHKQCSLQPIFSSNPGYGSSITFNDIAQHHVSQIDVIEALRQMFNLRIYSDKESKIVYIEPYDDFYNCKKIFDYTDKIDFTQGVEISDLALGVHNQRVWRYRGSDGSVERLNTSLESPFGEWQSTANQYATIEGKEVDMNVLFCPTINVSNIYSNAPSAQIMQVGNRDIVETSDDVKARIVRYCGMKRLPPDEIWGYPLSKSEYPLAAFHLAADNDQDGFTLCFEDRDSLPGLHSYYDNQITQEASRQKITLHLQLKAHEIESILTCGTESPDIQSIFKFVIDNQTIYCHLHSIEEYDHQKTTKCSFTRVNNDQL